MPLGSKIVVNETKSNAVAKQKESAHVTVSTLLFLCTLSRELPGFQKGRGPFVELREPRSNSPQFLLGGSTPLFFAQLRRIPIAVGSFAALRIWDAGLGSRKGPAGGLHQKKIKWSAD